MSKELAIYQEMPISELGAVLVKSRFFSDARDASQAIVKVLAGRELGFGPIASMTGIYIIKGKPALSANLMAAAVKRDSRYDYRISAHTNEACELTFFENGQEVGRSSFTIEDAQSAGLGGDNWRKYARNMLFARALSNGVKWFCPDLMSGSPVYTPDELGAEVDGETGEVIEGNAEEYHAEPEPEKPEPASYDAATVAAVIEAGLTKNAYSFANTMKHLNIPADAPKDLVMAAFEHWREARNAGADSDEAAAVANAWWEGERPLYEALHYTTDSGKVLGKLSPDELLDMIERIDGLATPSGKMVEIRAHCATLIDYLAQFEDEAGDESGDEPDASNKEK